MMMSLVSPRAVPYAYVVLLGLGAFLLLCLMACCSTRGSARFDLGDDNDRNDSGRRGAATKSRKPTSSGSAMKSALKGSSKDRPATSGAASILRGTMKVVEVSPRGRGESPGPVRAATFVVSNEKGAARAFAVAEDDKQRVESVQALALQLRGKYLKYPKDMGKNVFFFPKERYFALMPAEVGLKREEPNSGLQADDSARQLQRWRRGRLTYWEDEDAFNNGKTPKGHIDIMRIMKVTVDSASTEVKVKHWQDGATFELVLKFPIEHSAYTWGRALQEIRKHLQQTVLRV